MLTSPLSFLYSQALSFDGPSLLSDYEPCFGLNGDSLIPGPALLRDLLSIEPVSARASKHPGQWFLNSMAARTRKEKPLRPGQTIMNFAPESVCEVEDGWRIVESVLGLSRSVNWAAFMSDPTLPTGVVFPEVSKRRATRISPVGLNLFIFRFRR